MSSLHDVYIYIFSHEKWQKYIYIYNIYIYLVAVLTTFKCISQGIQIVANALHSVLYFRNYSCCTLTQQ